MEEDRGCDHP